jgi:hypothetical protein
VRAVSFSPLAARLFRLRLRAVRLAKRSRLTLAATAGFFQG